MTVAIIGAQGRLIVVTGPSGVGKGTLLKALLQNRPDLYLAVSATTRAPRSGEVDGQSYYFTDRPRFEQMVFQGELLEWAEFAGNLYGTPRQAVLDKIAVGESVVLEIELEGARQVRQNFPAAERVFILPPSLAELESRIRARGTDPEAAIVRRLARAEAEIAAADEFDLQIVNDEFAVALKQLEEFMPAPIGHPAPVTTALEVPR
jgi:guanylate kinase